MKTTIYVIRHGQSETNVNHLFAIDSHSSTSGGAKLTKLGVQQAESLRKKLKDVTFHEYFSSGLTRSIHTAEILAKGSGKTVTIIPSIHERVYGKEHTQKPAEEKLRIKNSVEQLPTDEMKLHFRFSADGESAQEAVDRFKGFLKEIAPKNAGKTIVVVGHGNIMRMLLVTLGYALYNELPHGAIENTGYYVIETDGELFKITQAVGVIKRL